MMGLFLTDYFLYAMPRVGRSRRAPAEGCVCPNLRPYEPTTDGKL